MYALLTKHETLNTKHLVSSTFYEFIHVEQS